MDLISTFPCFTIEGGSADAIVRSSCVGRNFALQEMRMLVATFVRRYDAKLAPGFDASGWENCIEDRGQIELKRPLMVVLSRRT